MTEHIECGQVKFDGKMVGIKELEIYAALGRFDIRSRCGVVDNPLAL